MALEIEVSSAAALVVSDPREKNVYQGQGDQRKVAGRVTDAEGRPLSGVEAVVLCEPLGLLGDATVLLPDVQMTGLVPGAVIRLDGSSISVKLSGRDFGVIAATVTAERQTPVGNYVEWIQAALNGKVKPGPEGRS